MKGSLKKFMKMLLFPNLTNIIVS